MKHNRLAFCKLLFACILLTTVSCRDEWNSHYKQDDGLSSKENLWQIIQAQPELKRFADILKTAGYDEILSKPHMFTIWAPKSETINTLDTSNPLLVKEFIGNHFANFAIPATGYGSRSIAMPNNKVVKFAYSGSGYTFGDVSVTQANILASNGVLHIINGYVPFQHNIWEYLEKREDLKSVKDYLYSFNRMVFVPELSIPGDVDPEEGAIIYLDSVFRNDNSMFRQIGRINNEDSTYTMILPTNKAWNLAYKEASNYFVYYDRSPQVVDSLKHINAQRVIVNNLVFSNTINPLSPAEEDTWTSTTRTVFLNPKRLMEDAIEVPLSNGRVFITDSLRHKPSETYHSPVIREAEYMMGRETTGAIVTTKRSLGNDLLDSISGNRYLEVVPLSLSNPTITFDVWGNLSAKYNIYCVFVPPSLENPAATFPPCKVTYRLTYMDAKGAAVTSSTITPAVNITDPKKVTKMLVTAGFRFPVANYGQEIASVKLRVMSDVTTAEQNNRIYTRTMLIDCIILEPVD